MYTLISCYFHCSYEFLNKKKLYPINNNLKKYVNIFLSRNSDLVLFFSICAWCLGLLCIHACVRWLRHSYGPMAARLLLWTKNRGLSWLEHDFSRGHSHVGGRGCVRCFCNNGPLLQVSRSTQKLLALSKVSEQTNQGSDPCFFSASGFGLLCQHMLLYFKNIQVKGERVISGTI